MAMLLAVLAAIGMLFHAEAAAVAVWLTSTAYGHCFFVLPIAAWLAWERRTAALGLLRRLTGAPAGVEAALWRRLWRPG